MMFVLLKLKTALQMNIYFLKNTNSYHQVIKLLKLLEMLFLVLFRIHH